MWNWSCIAWVRAGWLGAHIAGFRERFQAAAGGMAMPGWLLSKPGPQLFLPIISISSLLFEAIE
jgi:hypothetical protein